MSTVYSLKQLRNAVYHGIASTPGDALELSPDTNAIADIWTRMLADQHDVIDSHLIPSNLRALIELAPETP